MHGYLALTIFTAMLHACGHVLQKHGIAARMPRMTLGHLLSNFGAFLAAMSKNWAWLTGFLLTVVGSITAFQAIAMGDISVVKPLMKLQTAFTVLLGVLFLRERLSRREWAGVSAIAAGGVLLAIGAGESTEVVPSTRASFALFTSTFMATALLFQARAYWPARFTAEVTLACSAGLLFGVGDLMIKACTGIVKHDIGTFSVLDGASVTAVLATVELYLYIGANLTGFVMMQTAFANGRVSLIGPLIGIGSTVFPVLVGFAMFAEHPYPLRVAGIVTMVLGSVVLITREPDEALAALPIAEELAPSPSKGCR